MKLLSIRERNIKSSFLHLNMGFPYNYPLGLPKGSVRATITLLLSVELAFLTILDNPIADSIATMTLVGVVFYFGGKMRVDSMIPRSADRSLRAWGLPPGTIRFLLILIFSGTIGYLYYYQQIIPTYFIEVINIIAGYLAGRTFEFIRDKLFKKDEEDKVSIIDHLKSLSILGLTIVTIFYSFTEPGIDLTSLLIVISSWTLGFYFGSRD